jgi:hypothetical protein
MESTKESPSKAIRAFCIDCCCGKADEVRKCPSKDCSIHKSNLGTEKVKAIRLKCIDCSGGSVKSVKDCRATDCSLYPFRLGTNPNRAGIGNSKALQEHRQNQKKASSNAI